MTSPKVQDEFKSPRYFFESSQDYRDTPPVFALHGARGKTDRQEAVHAIPALLVYLPEGRIGALTAA